MKNELDTFIELTFYPPQSTFEYVDRIPREVRKKIVSMSNLSMTKYDERTGLRKLIEAYCYSINAYTTRNQFWQVIRAELIEYYERNES